MTKARDIASAAPAPAGVTSTELGYVDGVTSAIQTQLNSKPATASTVSTDGGSTITVASGSTVPLTIQNNGTGNSLVVNDVASDTAPFVIDANGNVGVGTSAPNLSGYGTSNLTVSSGTSAVQGVLELVGNRADGADFAAGDVNFFANSQTTNKLIARIQGSTNGTTANNRGGSLTFQTKADNGALGARMFIDNAGNTSIESVADASVTNAARGGGYMGVPQSVAATTGSYTIVAADAGEHIYSTGTRTITIPANASLALPVGTAISFIAATGATVTIAITSDTLLLAGAGTTGSRTLAPFGMATAIKITSTSWIISGNGLT